MLSPRMSEPRNITGVEMMACHGASPRTTPQVTNAIISGSSTAVTRHSTAPPRWEPTV